MGKSSKTKFGYTLRATKTDKFISSSIYADTQKELLEKIWDRCSSLKITEYEVYTVDVGGKKANNLLPGTVHCRDGTYRWQSNTGKLLCFGKKGGIARGYTGSRIKDRPKYKKNNKNNPPDEEYTALFKRGVL